MKNIKFRTSIINKIKNYKKLSNNKFFKTNNFNKSIIFLICTLFLYLFYLSIPSLYNKERLQKDLTSKILNEFGLNISLSSEINYLILPSPHILIKDVKIFDDNKQNPKELLQIKKLKVVISQINFFNRDDLKINKIIIDNANLTVQKKDFKYLNFFLNKKFSVKKIYIKNSNFFYNDSENVIITNFPIKNFELFYSKKNQSNQIQSNGLIFNTPFNLKWSIGHENKKSIFSLNLKKLKLNIKNISNKEDQYLFIKNIISFLNNTLTTNFKIVNGSLSFQNESSKLINHNLNYYGKINLDPFNLVLDIDMNKLNLNKLLFESYILQELLKTNLFFEKNLSGKITLSSNNITPNNLFDSLKFFFTIKNGKINFNNSKFINNYIGTLSLASSSLELKNYELFFIVKFELDINNERKFYNFFQIPKKYRKPLENIHFEVKINTNKKNLDINKIKINKSINDETGSDNSNLKGLNKINIKMKNRIDLKNYINQIFSTYSG